MNNQTVDFEKLQTAVKTPHDTREIVQAVLEQYNKHHPDDQIHAERVDSALMNTLFEKGIAVKINPSDDIVTILDEMKPWQMPVLHHSFGVPYPLSVDLMKHTEISRDSWHLPRSPGRKAF